MPTSGRHSPCNSTQKNMIRHTQHRAELTSALLLTLTLFTSLYSCMGTLNEPSSTTAPFDVHITRATEQDRATWKQIQESKLLFEKADRTFMQMVGDVVWQVDPYEKTRRAVNDRMAVKLGCERLMLETSDGEQIATMQRIAPDAKITIIYALGYFANQTPTKEWPAPFYTIFNDCNVLSFDWRSSGQSSGIFSLGAVNDILALLAHCKTHPELKKTKIVLASFCLGGGLALEALWKAQQHSPELLPDAFCLSCTPSMFCDIERRERIGSLAPNKVISAITAIRPIRRYMMNRLLDPAIQKLSPVHRLPAITVPICFEYCTKRDQFAPIKDCFDNYNAAVQAPLRFVIASDLSGHVRLQKDTPEQYRQAYITFFEESGLLDADQADVMRGHQVCTLSHGLGL